MFTTLAFYERLLRFYDLNTATDIMRARTIYIMGWSFIFMEVVNLILMTITYGEWTQAHRIAIFDMTVVLIATHMLRYCKSFKLYAYGFSLFLIGSITLAALEGGLGINSSLIPLLIAGCFLNAFVAGWREVAIYSITATGLIWFLFSVSLGAPPEPISEKDAYGERIFQRAVQASLALFSIAISCMFISKSMANLFDNLERLMAKAEESEKEKTEFLARISRETQMSLNKLIKANQKLMHCYNESERREYGSKIQIYGRKLKHILTYAFTLSELDTGRLALKNEAFNLRDILAEVLIFAEPHAREKGLNIGTSFAPKIPETFLGDGGRLTLVLKNLIANALMHTKVGSIYLTVNGRMKGVDAVRLKIKVEDTSEGVCAEGLEAIFKRFDPNAGKKSRGSLGLALSREIIEYMDGSLNVASLPGDGVSFEIILVLPIAAQTPVDAGRHSLEALATDAA